MKKLLLLSLLMIGLSWSAVSQVDYDKIKPATNKLFIKDVIIHNKPGSTIEYGSILIEDGIIKQVGKSISVPKDALILKADSMHIYPAFVDALSHAGVEKIKEEERPKVKFPGYPPDDVAGVVPSKSVMEVFDESSKDLSSMRKMGFGIVHTAPRGKMLPGQTAVLSLSGKPTSELVIKENQAVFGQLETTRGIFPATMIGVLSKFKELYRQAEGAKIHMDKYNRAPLGMKRPAYSDAINAFIPITQKQQTVFFKAKTAKDVHRILALQKELGFKLVLADVHQAYPVVDNIKAANVPVCLSLDLPEKPDGDKDDDNENKEDEENEEGKEKDKNDADDDLTDEEMEALKKRKSEAYAKYVGQAAALEKAGVAMSFSWIEAKPKDLRENMATLIENGLSEKAAISGLTTVPAEVLGISNIAGTLEKGKMGNIIISTKPIFEKGSNIKFMLVDGEMFEYEVKEKKKKKSSGEAIDVTGEYTYEIKQFDANGKMTVLKDGDEYQVKLESSDGGPIESVDGEEVELNGNEMSFNFTVDANGNNMDVSVSLEFEEEGFEGTITTNFGAAPIEGSKTDPN